MKEFVAVIVKPPMRPAYTTIVKNRLEAFQTLVGGYVEAVPLHGCLMLVNEEGKLRGLTVNLAYGSDLIAGTAVFVGARGSEFTDCGLPWSEICAQVTDLWLGGEA